MKAETVARAILSDRDKLAAKPQREIFRCFTCERPYTKGDGRFCSANCRNALDAGLPPGEFNPGLHPELLPNLYGLEGWRVVGGPPGIEVGPLYYADIIEACDWKREAKAEGEDLIRPRRRCKGCGAKLPVWIKGRKVPSSRKFCDGCK
jgi:hypothetical protein